ncbi:DUF2314 domain-containing protein [Flavobacteriaceae bacterium M23B6Z8]
MKKIIITIVLFVCFICRSQEASVSALATNKILIEYAIYFLDDQLISVETATTVTKKWFPDIEIIDELPDPENVKGIRMSFKGITEVKKHYPPADMEYLKYTALGLSEPEKKALQNSNYVLLVGVIAEHEKQVEALSKVNELVLKLIGEKKAVIYDVETRETLSKDYWKTHRLISNASIDISKHITIHFYPTGEYCRAITLGMFKFGLPDICIEELSCKSDLALGSFINLTAQTLWETNKLHADGKLVLDINAIQNEVVKDKFLSDAYENAFKKASVTLKEGTRQEGDPENRLLEISFPGENPQIQHDEVLKKVFGFKDEVVSIAHDEEILKASKKAKAKIPELYKLFSSGMPVNMALLMKFPFESEYDGTEWMWVEITRWNENKVHGLLQNDPAYIKDLKSGQKVTKNVNDMFDYILYKPDGTSEGNETGKIMMRDKN